jgi:hypothetical protein
MNPKPADFAPAAQSPLLDMGFAGDQMVAIPPTDFFGLPRVGRPDIGAIERQ